MSKTHKYSGQPAFSPEQVMTLAIDVMTSGFKEGNQAAARMIGAACFGLALQPEFFNGDSDPMSSEGMKAMMGGMKVISEIDRLGVNAAENNERGVVALMLGILKDETRDKLGLGDTVRDLNEGENGFEEDAKLLSHTMMTVTSMRLRSEGEDALADDLLSLHDRIVDAQTASMEKTSRVEGTQRLGDIIERVMADLNAKRGSDGSQQE